MKRLTAVLAMLCVASLAHAGGSKLNTKTLPWGTWTPQGFVASTASALQDTIFINGALAQSDTTGPLSTSDWDWAPYANTPDLNAALLSVAKLFVSGTFVSYDSAFVSIEGSIDNGTSWVAFTTSAYAMTQIGAGGGTQQVLATPVNLIAPLRGPLGVTSSTATIGVHPMPLFRFIVRGDGNTAARGSGLRFSVSYHRTDGRDGHAPQFEWKRLQFATYNNDGYGGLRLSSPKDTSSFTFSAPDTTEWFDMSRAKVGPFSGASAADTTALGAYLLCQLSNDVSSIDSFYVCVDGAALPGYRWNTTPLIGTAGGFIAAASSAIGAGGEGGFLIGLPAHVVTAITAGPGALAGTPYVRFRLFGGNGGEVAGGAKVWLGYWKNPYQE